MDLIKSIVEYFKKPKAETTNQSPEGVCELCWGIQAYDGKIRDVYRDKQVDVNNHEDSYLLIQKFVKENMDGYHVKDGVIHVCDDCKILNADKMKDSEERK